jgi:uncharacterized protein YcbK (DUF882 family)
MDRRIDKNVAGRAAESKSSLTRRHLLKAGAVAAATVLVPGMALADEWVRFAPRQSSSSGLTRARFLAPQRSLSPATAGVRSVSMYNVHTDESLNAVYYENGEYLPDALAEVNHFFRDFRANETKPIDPHLLDLLFDVHSQLDTSKPFNLVSGYRSPATNAWLASMSEGVARHSMHLEGKAADINLPGRQLSFLERVALAYRLGGVGYYPRSGFVHVDTGRVRHW